jgi:hypothetical protein
VSETSAKFLRRIASSLFSGEATVADINNSHLNKETGVGSASVSDWDTERRWWQENYRSRPYVNADRGFSTYEPGYRYGYESANRYRGRTWSDVENDLRAGWDRYEHRGSAGSKWEHIKDSVKDAWDHVTGGEHARH